MSAPPNIQLASLGMADSLILMVLALVVFGPRRLPQIGRQIGKLMYEFRKASNDFKFQMEEELRIAEDLDRRKKDEAEVAARLALATSSATVEASADIGAVEQASVSAQPPTVGQSTVESAPDAYTGSPSPFEGRTAPDGHTLATQGQPSPYAGESTYPEQYPPESMPVEPAGADPVRSEPVRSESASAEPAQPVTLPRTAPVIQPPSTGEPIPAARPGAVSPAADRAATANSGAEASQDPKQTEPVNHHG